MIILGLDQSLDVTGWCYKTPDDIYHCGMIKCPSPTRRDGLSEARWMKLEIKAMIERVRPSAIALEWLHLGAGKKKNVDTLINLAQFRGRLCDLADDFLLPVITVTSPDLAKYLHLSAFADRDTRKARSQFIATVLLKGQAYSSDGKNELLDHNISDAVCIHEIAAARWHEARLVAESEGK